MRFESPEFLNDLYRDLRDRRLLPLAALLLVAMVIVPVALSDSSKPKGPASQASGPAPSPQPASSLLGQQVTLSDPGIRDYQRRLAGDAAEDPFIPRVQGGGSDSSQAASAAAAATTAATGGLIQVPTDESAALTPEGEAAAAAASGSPSGASTGSVAQTTPSSGASTRTGSFTETMTGGVFSYQLKVKTGPADGELKTRNSVSTLTALPGKAVPALSFLGVTVSDSLTPKRAFFLVSDRVSTIDGEGDCEVPSDDGCQLLALKAGQHADLTWADGVVYRVRVVDFVLTDKPIAAPKGKRERSSSGSSDRRPDARPPRLFIVG